MNNIVICGDSYNIGIGCHDLENEPYGSLLAKELNLNLINLAKGSSSNLSIYLQAKYAVENIQNISLVCVALTSYNRTEWFPESENAKNHWNLTNTDVNYHQYPPYGEFSYQSRIDHPMMSDARYKGLMLTENYGGIVDYVDNFVNKNKNIKYFDRLKTERPERMRLLKDYFLEIFDEGIQRVYDMGVITMSHVLLKNNNIPHLILAWDDELLKYIDEENILKIDWGELSLKYPDDLKSCHTSYEGHIEVFEKIMEKLNKK